MAYVNALQNLASDRINKYDDIYSLAKSIKVSISFIQKLLFFIAVIYFLILDLY